MVWPFSVLGSDTEYAVVLWSAPGLFINIYQSETESKERLDLLCYAPFIWLSGLDVTWLWNPPPSRVEHGSVTIWLRRMGVCQGWELNLILLMFNDSLRPPLLWGSVFGVNWISIWHLNVMYFNCFSSNECGTTVAVSVSSDDEGINLWQLSYMDYHNKDVICIQ